MGNKITKEKLGSKIWAAANKLRDKLEAYEYKDYVLGLILYKFLCEKQTDYLIKNWVSKDQLKYFDSKYLDNISNFSAFYTGDNLEGNYEIFKDAKKRVHWRKWQFYRLFRFIHCVIRKQKQL
ncbi:type I restriction-modification system subunit M N-terminal domain-containing protein [Mycoplasmopsis agalactiae]|uniref:type I restriction-modification system subunit M N-terminal domain-containing protein n=1 Tax=Mycoplasmopsis agalactiae TaxID=2110 RepID=UPI001F1D5CC1|nr:type I restriction-modification system subunit M N-terminal domain-containing protein [Mycoplasmopsis agalactiae]